MPDLNYRRRGSHRNSCPSRLGTGRCDDGSREIASRMLPELHSILNLLEGGFSQLKVLVIGDIMLDRYIHGEVDRISPEAPVPILRHARRYERAGGAANVAMNLAGVGCQTFLSGFWGSDSERHELAGLLGKAGIDTTGIVTGT